MQRYKRFLFLLLGLALLTACAQSDGDALSGEVWIHGSRPEMFVIRTDSGENYGFYITDDSRLTWEDTSVLDARNSMRNYDEWDGFSCDLWVDVVPGPEAAEPEEDLYLEEEIKAWYDAGSVTVTKVNESYFSVDAKPVIYLYPEQPTEVAVRLDYQGKLTCTYPAYNDGWQVTAHPDGTLTDQNGQTYNYLYWEGSAHPDYDLSRGFCVPGAETAAFLEKALADLGLNRREANEFIVYWLPLMEQNPYNLITFQQEAYTDHAPLTVTPTPDTILRVFMAWKPLTAPIEIEPQTLSAPNRTGFTLVEWGGTELE